MEYPAVELGQKVLVVSGAGLRLQCVQATTERTVEHFLSSGLL